jgi:hypothetical protein
VKASRVWLTAWIALGLFAGGAVFIEAPGFASIASAQNLGQRNVSGSVLDADSTALAGATVFLKNQKTKSIRSYTSNKEGRFFFAQVNMAEDYDLWAEKDGHKSAIKTVSSWDSRKEYETELRMK